MSNHLRNETSPYLQTHSTQPVLWYPWGEEALTLATTQNKSIFLSIGHGSSSWCDIMSKESFQNESIAELLNERFIAIKVDKEEHPEVAKYYKKVYSLMNRSVGAYPLSIFMTENLEPFYAGSYISTQAQQEQLGFEELLRVISKKYITDYDTLVKKGDEVLQYINPKEQKIEATRLHIDILNTITSHTDNLIDKQEGGFGDAPKFPNSSTLELLLDTYQLKKEPSLLNATLNSLDAMANKSLYDEKNGGFYNYSKDAKWLTPYKVKTTYDNALLIQLYLRAYQLSNNIFYKEIAFKTLDFMLNTMGESKLFFSKIDETKSETTMDKTVITSWNAMMVSTLFKASSVDEKYQKIAIDAIETLLEKTYINHKLYRNTSLKTEAFLEDYAYLGEALIEAYQATLDESYLIMATQFSNTIIEQFYEHGKWKFSNGAVKIEEDTYDSDYPSSLSTAISLLMSISSLVDGNYKKFVFKTLELNSYNLMRQPLSSPKLTSMLLRYLKDDIIIKSNENLLKKHITKRSSMQYPYVLFKTTLDENILLCNSSSCFAQTSNFDTLKTLIESHLKL